MTFEEMPVIYNDTKVVRVRTASSICKHKLNSIHNHRVIDSTLRSVIVVKALNQPQHR